jgi:uncharacterized protein YjbI with pentapeptide repeats
VFAFGLAPAVFVAVHFYTLIRYDMLEGNIRRFVGDLAVTVPSEVDRDRCRQLLANVEFVNARAMPKGSRASSRMFRWTVRALLAAFPVLVLLIVQLQSLRLQNQLVTWVNHVCILADLVLLIWFFGRLRGGDSWRFWKAPIPALCWLLFSLTIDLLWLEVPWPASKTVGHNLGYYWRQYPKASASFPVSFMEQIGWWIWFQPIDLLFCRPGVWGCRFLTVAHRVIVPKVWDTAAFVAVRAGAGVDAQHRASFEGASLREHTLRFADLTASELYGADLTGADLTRADLTRANLTGADLTDAHLNFANLTGANLNGAHLNGADLSDASLNGADLGSTNLRGAYLNNAALAEANLNHADLIGAHLTGANLIGAHLNGAGLSDAHLNRADLIDADLTGAHLNFANLNGANLIRANLTGAYLNIASLNGADLTGANLTGANLNGANLNGANLNGVANLIQNQLDEACGTDTKLPPGLTLKPCPSPVK